MQGLGLLLINGASGSGKTTLAKALSERIPEAVWIHPDGLMDTPNMDAESILSTSITFACSGEHGSPVIIDCQIRPSCIDALIRPNFPEYVVFLLDCPRQVREERLVERGWTGEDFDRIEAWASVLRDEAELAGHEIFDTGSCSVDSVAYKIERRLRDDA